MKKRKAPKSAWETIHKCNTGESNRYADPGVRRLAVPGGWLYQVQRGELELTFDNNKTDYGIAWHPPAFVANGNPMPSRDG